MLFAHVLRIFIYLMFAAMVASSSFYAGLGFHEETANLLLVGIVLLLLCGAIGRFTATYEERFAILTYVALILIVFISFTLGSSGNWGFGLLMSLVCIIGYMCGLLSSVFVETQLHRKKHPV